jgi:hypothetical protein
MLKKNSIIKSIINTNATHLNEKVANKLIDSRLQMLIYSCDGGSKKTYEKVRSGKFKENKFEKVYVNIKKFTQLKKIKKLRFSKHSNSNDNY